MKKIIYWIIILILADQQCFSQPKGKLVIIGGVQTGEIIKRFTELAGGSNAKIIIIPNAGSEPKENSEIQKQEFSDFGASSDYLLFSRETADNEENLKKIDQANAVFFLGGDQSDLARDMLGTKLLEKVFRIYENGGVVGGTSAGAAVMSKVMITGNELINKDSVRNFISIQKGNVETKQGFGFLKNVIIDQHFLKRKRHNRLISLMIEHPDLLGVAIDESTSIIVYPDETFEVLGSNQVIVYDPTVYKQKSEDKNGNLGIDEMRMHVLISGQKFDLKKKELIK
ncbi:MAG TPA: cyanophycinase [Ignavibacteriaceae bacterium]|jgi:cyanophycinase|nr:cyanophycinase [Ignavibacteriaceae bacterium]